MSVVGSVEVQVSAISDPGVVTRQISEQMQKPVTEAGKAAGRTMGRHVAESAAHELEKGGARFARSGRLLADVFTSNSAAALGPLQEVADKVDLIGTSLESTRTKAGGVLLGIGAAATGVGAFLSTLASREQGATNRLAASITASGGDISTYREEIEKAVKSGEKFGQSGNQTIDAIQALTIGLHDPKKALEELSLAEDIAATKQIPLSSAANLVRQAYNGNTRVLKAFGIQVGTIVDGQKLLKDAHDAASKASTDASKAQKEYSDKLAIYRDTLKPTLAQQIGLKNAHDKLLDATVAQTAAQAGLVDAQKQANEAGSKGQEVLDKLAQITAGQAAASADTFTGHLKAWGAAIEDNAAKIGGKAGTALVEFGPALAAGGFLIESGLIPKLGRGVGALLGFGGTATATAVEVETASAAEVASLDTVVLAIRELQASMGGIGPAAAAGAVEVGTATAAMDAEFAATAAAAETASAAASASLLSMLGPIAVITAALVGAYVVYAKIAVPIIQHGEGGDPTHLGYSDNTTPGSNPAYPGIYDPNHMLQPTPGDATHIDEGQHALASAKTTQTATDRAIEAARKKAAADQAQSTAEFLKQFGLGPLASSTLNKALSDAQKAAGDHAKKIGAEVTAGIKAQVATVKTEIAGLNKELKSIADLRGQVIGQAASFASITSLLPDNSLATSGSLVRGLQSRVGAEALFGKNITALTARHLDKGVITEILKQGPEQARSIAAALMLGPDSDIAKLNLAERAARQQAQVLGGEAVAAQFGIGTQARANTELARANAQLAMLNKQIAAQPALIAKAVDQAQKNAKVTSTAKTRTAVPR